MQFSKWFTKLMKSEPVRIKKAGNSWIVDENKCLTMDELNQLRDFCSQIKLNGLKNRKFASIRNWFMIELGINSGLRVNEMATLKQGDLRINGDRSSILVLGKGNKKRVVWIGTDFKRKCIEYINYKKRFGYSTDDDSYLFNNLKGNKITKRALQKFFKNILKKAGLPDYYYIHCLRHTYTTFLLKASNYNYRFVQQQLGHSSIRTTQVYAGILESDGKIALEKLYKS